MSASTPSRATGHVSVSQVRRSVKKAITKGEWEIQGECVAPVQSGTKWNFDLVTLTADGVDILSCTLWEDKAPEIEDSLRRAGLSLQQAMTAGMVLKLTGTTWLAQDGKVCVRVAGIEPGFARRGALYLADRTAKAELRAAGVPSERLGEPFAHANPKTAFRDINCKPNRIMVLSPAGAKAAGDFKHHLRNSGFPCREVVYRALSWTENSSLKTMQAHLDEAHRRNMDLVVLVRGGGPWSHMRGYDRVDLALAIHRSPVPVATAVGHNADVSLTDRAAKLSFITPTAAADAIGSELKREFFEQKRNAFKSADETRRKSERINETAERDDAQKTIRRLELELREAKKAAVTAQNDAADAHRIASERSEQAYRSAAIHTQDLLEGAERRVRFISRLATLASLAAGVALVVYTRPALWPTAAGLTGYWMSIASIISLCGILVIWQRSARRKISVPSAKPMRHPHPDADSWRQATKSVWSIRGLRKLRHHRPI